MLQALWEEKSTGAKWVKVNWCYYPSDLPVEIGEFASADDNEVSLNCAQWQMNWNIENQWNGGEQNIS